MHWADKALCLNQGKKEARQKNRQTGGRHAGAGRQTTDRQTGRLATNVDRTSMYNWQHYIIVSISKRKLHLLTSEAFSGQNWSCL